MASGGSLPVITGSYVATGAALDVEVGFRPKYVKFVNATTGASAEWSDTMADASVVTHDTGVDAVDTAQGVTPGDSGFSLGTNAVVNTSTNIVHFIALA